MPPITTPFEKGELSLKRLKENFAKWNKIGLSGYAILGSNGENVFLTEAEKLKVIETSRQSIPKSKVMMVGTGREATRETIAVTNQAAGLGADCALVATPAFFKGSMKQDVLHDHFVAVAEASRIPVLVYNALPFTGINIEPETVARLSLHPNIVGLKDSSGNVEQLSRIIDMSQKGFKVFVGSAPVFFPALCLGAVGGVLALANAVPEECIRILALFNEGKMKESRALQGKVTPLAKAVTSVYGVSGLKAAMDLAGYFGGDPRLPLKPATPAMREELKKLLGELK
jgi:4-hydroxy-2-oxoglutarate aldolase